MKLKLMANHTPDKRAVILNKYGAVAPVISATRHKTSDGRIEIKTTYQDLERAQFVIMTEMVRGEMILKVCRYSTRDESFINIIDRPDMDQFERTQVLKTVSPTILNWLHNLRAGDNDNFLPAGFGWDGIYTDTEIHKGQRVRNLLIGIGERENMEADWIKSIIELAIPTSGRFIQTDWDSAKPLPAYLNDTRIHEHAPVDVIFCYGSPIYKQVRIKPKRIIGATTRYKGVAVPADVSAAIVIKHGLMIDDDGGTNGVQIELYRRVY